MERAIKWATGLLCTIAFFCGGFVILHGSLPPASINAWLPAGNLTAARSGAASVLLQDGRLLITGGNGASGALATTEILDPANGFTAGPLMNLARSNHVAVPLQDGRVLVAGGTDASGRASQSAELFDAAANSWSAAGPLMVGRSGATATLLPSGQVLIAGGTANGMALASLELFDPNSNTFTLVGGTLSSARENHAAALLPDGRVLIAGGWDGTTLAPVPPATTGTANVLASTDIFDPSTGAVAPGPTLTSPRMNFTATMALDGSVIAIGGTDGQNDLASIDALAPGASAFALSGAKLATARQGHLAFLLPHNGNILVVGGTSSGASISSAELYTPWTGATGATGAMASARSSASGSPLFQTVLGAPVGIDGALLVAGGLDASSPPSTLPSAEVYGFATITTDKPDYPPGTPVTITGNGWQPNETVQMSLVEVPDLDGDSPIPLAATADANGNITNTSFATNIDDLGVHFTLTAVGAVSQAQTTFTDNKTVTIAFSGTGSGNVTSSPGSINCADTSGTSSGTCSDNSFTNGATVALTAAATLPSTIGTWSVTGVTISSGCTSGNTSCVVTAGANGTVTVTFNAGAATKYLVTSSNNSPAAGSQVTISAQLADSGGNPVHTSGRNVAWSHTGSGGSFSSANSLTNANGVASVTFTTGTVAGTVYTITANDGSVSGTSGNVTTVAGTLTTLVFGQQPTNTLAGQTITPAISVTEKDSNGNTITSDNSTHLTISILNNPSTGTLSGTTNVVVSGGVATFSTLSINNAGNGYTLQAHAPGNINVTSNPFNIIGQFNVTFAVSGMLTGGSADSTGTVVSISGTSGGVAVGPFNETAANLPFTHSFDSGTTVTYSYSSPVATGSASKQYRWNTTSGLSQTLQSNAFTVTAAGTVTATYVAQYKVTFDASANVKGDSTATIVTVGANAETAASLPYTTDFLDSGSSLSYSYQSPVASSGAATTTRYRWDSTSGLSQTLQSNSFNVTAAGTVTATYVTQYQVTFDASSNVKGDSTATIVTVDAAAKAAGSLPFSKFVDSGTSVMYSYSSPVASSGAPTTTRYRWDSTSGLSQTLQSATFNVTAAGTVTGAYVTQYKVIFDATGLGGDVLSGSTIVTVNSVAQTTAPYSVFLDAGSTPSYAYSSPISTTVTGKRYILTTPAPTPATGFTVTGTITITAAYKAQYDTTTAVVSSVNPSILAQPVQFTATVTTIASGGGTPTGSVQFKVDGSNFGSPVALSGGIANSTTTTTLTVGTHTVEADYTPDTDTYTSSIGTLSGGQKVQYMTGGTCDGDLGHSILQPVNLDGSSVFKQTSTVPAKFRVCDFNGNSIGTAGVVSSFRLVQVVGGTMVNNVDEAVDLTTPDTMFRWDPTGQQWIFNISTKGAPVDVKNQTYYFTISLNDGSTITFHFGLR